MFNNRIPLTKPISFDEWAKKNAGAKEHIPTDEESAMVKTAAVVKAEVKTEGDAPSSTVIATDKKVRCPGCNKICECGVDGKANCVDCNKTTCKKVRCPGCKKTCECGVDGTAKCADCNKTIKAKSQEIVKETCAAVDGFVKISKLDAKQKQFLSAYWKNLYPVAYVEAMLQNS
ncbi:MAG: hypothetical protein AABY32_02715 [Nanoarchaeota archaeon]